MGVVCSHQSGWWLQLIAWTTLIPNSSGWGWVCISLPPCYQAVVVLISPSEKPQRKKKSARLEISASTHKLPRNPVSGQRDLQSLTFPGEYSVKVAEKTEQESGVSKIIRHEEYTIGQVNHDIALLKLETPVNLTDFVVPICLPEKRFAVYELSSIKFSMVSGWGRLLDGGATSTFLMRVHLPRVKTQECEKQANLNITENMFCAGDLSGKKDSCKGDSGGPHATKYKNTWFLTGIVSWGKGCAVEGSYGVYTRVSRYINWLKRHMEWQQWTRAFPFLPSLCGIFVLKRSSINLDTW